IGKPTLSGSYYPNDWNQNWPNDTLALAFINAPEAWNICKGDSNIIIGLSDTFFDLIHEDMQGQYAKIGKNDTPSNPAFLNHGSLVASLIAAKSNNGIGNPGIGFHCRLFATSAWGSDKSLYDMVMDTSVNGLRVLNASWGRGNPIENLFFNSDVEFLAQGLYNEMYEKGVVIVAAAGNGREGIEKNARTHIFPASFNHAISVSSVGYESESVGDSAFNAQYVHEFYAGDSLKSHQHNSKVDICAPGVRISGHDFDPNDPSVKYQFRAAWGTSFSSP